MSALVRKKRFLLAGGSCSQHCGETLGLIVVVLILYDQALYAL